MTVIVEPDDDRNTHHVKLSDGVTDVGLILCDRNGNDDPRGFRRDPIPRSSVKIYAGEQRHSDLLPPWDDRGFNDWSGGRGGEKLEDDTSRYYDSRCMDTSRGGQIILGPMAQYARGVRSMYAQNWDPFYWWSGDEWAKRGHTGIDLYGANLAIAVRYTMTTTVASPPATYIPVVHFWVKKTGDPGTGYVYIYSDDAGDVDAAVANMAGEFGTLTTGNEIPQEVAISPGAYYYTLTTATAYHVVFYGGDNADADNYYTIYGNTTAVTTSGYTVRKSADLSTWAAYSNYTAPYFRVVDYNQAQFGAHFAELKGALYAALEYYDGTTSKVLINGTAGKATTGYTASLEDTNNTAGIDDGWWDGGIVRLTSGTGAHVPSPWRGIDDTVGSSTAGTSYRIYSVPAWDSSPSSTTEYAVIGCGLWKEVTGHSLSAGQYITDALGVNGAIYFARGDGAVMKRLREFWASSTYYQWTDESGTGTFLEKITNPTTTDIWLAKRISPAQISRAPGLDCTGTATVASLSFGTAINVGDLGEKITNLMVAGESYPMLHVFKEGSIHQVVYDAPNELRISALRNAADERNGAAACVNDVYMYFSFLDSVERYYRGQIDDVGPARGGALEWSRRGRISSMVSYPGRVYAAIDAGSSGYPSIMCYNGGGWHEVWRAPIAGGRMTGDMYIQPLPGDNADRLWFAWNGDILWIPLSIDPYNHNGGQTYTGYQPYSFAPGGAIETAWFHFGMEEIDKLYNKVTITAEGTGNIYLAYKLDDDLDYTAVGKFTLSSGVGSLTLDDAYSVVGKRIRLRIHMEATNANMTPRITNITIEGLVTVPHKYETVLTFKVEDNAETLLDNIWDDITDADTKLDKLSEWASDAGTVTMEGHLAQLDGKYVKIDAPSFQILEHTVMEVGSLKRNKFICQMRLIEVN